MLFKINANETLKDVSAYVIDFIHHLPLYTIS